MQARHNHVRNLVLSCLYTNGLFCCFCLCVVVVVVVFVVVVVVVFVVVFVVVVVVCQSQGERKSSKNLLLSIEFQLSAFLFYFRKIPVQTWLGRSCIVTDNFYGFPQIFHADSITVGMRQTSLWPFL
jgi:hypothetical protein